MAITFFILCADEKPLLVETKGVRNVICLVFCTNTAKPKASFRQKEMNLFSLLWGKKRQCDLKLRVEVLCRDAGLAHHFVFLTMKQTDEISFYFWGKEMDIDFVKLEKEVCEYLQTRYGLGQSQVIIRVTKEPYCTEFTVEVDDYCFCNLHRFYPGEESEDDAKWRILSNFEREAITCPEFHRRVVSQLLSLREKNKTLEEKLSDLEQRLSSLEDSCCGFSAKEEEG
ncbi:hypothetical protein GMAR_ORF261 [Golden Marseillevirus]|uniref:hypothetical protein n=1 Tax=Golden Marseillevirus TaxID=1720526 RepID=UPI000877AB2A|nr:hypothetical protein GMAR_ORF261 [Golden Marseillevirus]ALX27635.1 hypothetical protein GMAR_ORF261 [Golden Marseillevirus]